MWFSFSKFTIGLICGVLFTLIFTYQSTQGSNCLILFNTSKLSIQEIKSVIYSSTRHCVLQSLTLSNLSIFIVFLYIYIMPPSASHFLFPRDVRFPSPCMWTRKSVHQLKAGFSHGHLDHPSCLGRVSFSSWKPAIQLALPVILKMQLRALFSCSPQRDVERENEPARSKAQRRKGWISCFRKGECRAAENKPYTHPFRACV